MIPKPKREKSKKYLEYIKTLPCCCRDHTCTGDVVPHHTTTKKVGGSDYDTIPLCATHHLWVHSIGKTTFQDKHGCSFEEEIYKCRTGYIKKLEDK